MEKLTIHEVLKAVNGELLNYIHDIHDKKIAGISMIPGLSLKVYFTKRNISTDMTL